MQNPLNGFSPLVSRGEGVSVVEELLKKLLEKEGGILRAFFFHKTSSREIAEDLFQDLMVRLVRNGSLKKAETPKAYLFRSAVNLVTDFYRRDATERRMSQELSHSHDKHDALDAERIVAAQQKIKIVEQALSELPDRCRQIFIMVKADGKKQKVVAEELGISLRTVESNLVKALLHCQKRLRQEGVKR